MSENLALRRAIACQLLGHELDEHGCAPCPGAPCHTTAGAPTDFRVFLDGSPTGCCFHDSCAAAVAAFNHELRTRIARAEAGDAPRIYLGEGVAPPPAPPRPPKRPPFDPAALARLAGTCREEITLAWLRERSPVRIPPPAEQGPQTAVEIFLPALFKVGETVLIFTSQLSQGDFAWRDNQTFRLGRTPGTGAVPSALPSAGPEGAWFLCQPVSGEWSANPYTAGGSGPPKLGRRHGGCVTAWRHLLLESDEAPEAEWLRALVTLPLPVVAITTSGGRSVHGLIRVDCESKAAFDQLRDSVSRVCCPIGADGAALSGVRLARLPGVLRCGSRAKDGKLSTYGTPRLQELAWLNPAAPARPILSLV